MIAPSRIEIQSPLAALFETGRLGTAERSHRVASLASQYLAAVLENEEQDDIGDEFHRALYVEQMDGDKKIRDVIDTIEESLLTGDELAMATRASPLSITPFGRSCSLTGLSPESCRFIVDQLDSLNTRSPASSPPEVLALLLANVKDIPEGQATRLADVYRRRSQFPVKPADLENVIRSWISGVPFEHIFSSLPYVRRSKKVPPVDAWLEGLPEPTAWDDDFDRYYDFISQVLQSFLPWVCRGVEVLKEYSASSRVREAPWPTYADFLEHGVDTRWAILALNGSRQLFEAP